MEDGNNRGDFSALHEEDEKGEARQPFLKDQRDADESSVSVPASAFGFNYGHRPYKDIGFSIAFAVFIFANLGIGIFAIVNHNPKYRWGESSSSDCILPTGASFGGRKESSSGNFSLWNSLIVDAQSGLESTVKLGLYTVGITLCLSAPLAYFLLWLLRVFTKELVYITIPLCLISELAFFIAFFVICNSSQDCSNAISPAWVLGFGILLALIFAWIIYKNWDRVELSIRIMRTAAEALYKNLGLLVVLPILDLSFYLYFIPTFVFLYYARTNGLFVANPEIVENPKLTCGDLTVRDCCVWQSDAWVPVYDSVGILTLTWAAKVASEIHAFTISGTVSQWYFSLTGSSTSGNIKRSLGHAVGPSFGTLCFSGLIVTFVRMIRSAMESSEGNRSEVGCVALLVRACLQCLISAVEFVTKFTTNFAAITGENFCSSASMTFEMLKRNLLSTIVVEAVAGRLFSTAVLVFTIVYGLLLWGVLAVVAHDAEYLAHVALTAAIVLMLILFFMVRVLQHIVDTVYICYAMDKDNNEVSKSEVHEVYILLPAAPDNTASLAVPR